MAEPDDVLVDEFELLEVLLLEVLLLEDVELALELELEEALVDDVELEEVALLEVLLDDALEELEPPELLSPPPEHAVITKKNVKQRKRIKIDIRTPAKNYYGLKLNRLYNAPQVTRSNLQCDKNFRIS